MGSRWIFMVTLGHKDNLGSRDIDAEQTKRLAADTGLPRDPRAQYMWTCSPQSLVTDYIKFQARNGVRARREVPKSALQRSDSSTGKLRLLTFVVSACDCCTPPLIWQATFTDRAYPKQSSWTCTNKRCQIVSCTDSFVTGGQYQRSIGCRLQSAWA